jgi:murein DD-endopeptidase MepM/ murein hydrolase activator NlpD
MQPRRDGVSPVAVPVSATDVEYFKANPLMVPVDGVAPGDVPDTFNSPRDGGGRLHRATDIMAPLGRPVVAATAGKILRLSRSRLGGITIYMLDDNARFLYYYAHLDHYAEHLEVGEHVVQGKVLGYVGSTGNADPRAPHLHFQAMRWDPTRHDYWDGTPVDVRPFFSRIGKEGGE